MSSFLVARSVRAVARPAIRSMKPTMVMSRMAGARSLPALQAVTGATRLFSAKVGSDDSHSDFAPERKAAASVEGDEELTDFLNTVSE